VESSTYRGGAAKGDVGLAGGGAWDAAVVTAVVTAVELSLYDDLQCLLRLVTAYPALMLVAAEEVARLVNRLSEEVAEMEVTGGD